MKATRKGLFPILILFAILMLFTSCDPQTKIPDDKTRTDLMLGPVATEGRAFLAEYGVDESVLHAHLLQFALGYNRVTSLVNSVLFADMEHTSREVVKQRVEAAIVEMESFVTTCKDLEELGTQLETALEAYDEAHPRTVKPSSTREETEDLWYARRLVELMLDHENPVRYDLNDISRKTGVSTKKLLYMMQHATDQLNTQVDVVNAEEYDKEIAYLETVRDTAGTINSTLAFATPLGAFGAGAKAVSATATAANTVGWVDKAKKAYTVVENASAMITFTDNVVNIAVDEKNIPPTFKTVAEYNKSLGLLLSAKGSFTGDSAGDKLLAVVGVAGDTVPSFFEVKEDKVVRSTTPLIPGTPTIVDTPDLGGVLPDGAYLVPDVDSIDQWFTPYFDWGDGEKWEDLFDGIVDESFITELDTRFQDLIDSWDPDVNNGKRRPVEVDTGNPDGLPDFFEEADGDFPDHGELAKEPEATEFTVGMTIGTSAGVVPFDASFTAILNGAFLYGQTVFTWDFGDGTTVTVSPGDSGYGAHITHRYTDATEPSYTVTLTARDPRGFSATKSSTLKVGHTLQQLIDSYPEYSAIHIPAGTYTENISLQKGCHLKGAGKESTIIEGTVTLAQDTTLEALTVRYGGIRNSTDEAGWVGQEEISIDIIDVVVDQVDMKSAAIIFSDTWWDDYDGRLPYGGTIEGTSVKDNRTIGIDIDILKGTLRDNIVERNTTGIDVGTMTTGASIVGNTVDSNSAWGLNLYEMTGGLIKGNSIVNNDSTGLQIDTVLPGSIITDNTISHNTRSDGNGGGVSMAYLGTDSTESSGGSAGFDISIDARFTNNTISGNHAMGATTLKGGGVFIHTMRHATVEGNTIVNNTSDFQGGGIFLQRIHSDSTIGNNTISGNTSGRNGGGCYVGNSSYDYYLKDTNSIEGNSLTDPEPGAKVDLYSYKTDDVLPEDTE